MKLPLIIIYHREPYDDSGFLEGGRECAQDTRSPNGVLPTLKSIFASFSQATWVAWKQVAAADRKEFRNYIQACQLDDRHLVYRIPLTYEDIESFYYITSKEALWPILHSFECEYKPERSDWDTFRRINISFAEAALDAAEAACKSTDCAIDEASFFIHDYNLWLVPYYIRQRLAKAKIVFFHHTPFPEKRVFKILPKHWQASIIESLLCCDVCGFHIPQYVENFVSTVESLKRIESKGHRPVHSRLLGMGTKLYKPEVTTRITYNERDIFLKASPANIDVREIRRIVTSIGAKAQIEKLRLEKPVSKLILFAGRVDYIKGAKEMLLCYERLLKKMFDLDRAQRIDRSIKLFLISAHPAKGMTVYEPIQREIETLVARINRSYSRAGWTPIEYRTTPVPREELLKLYCVADILWAPSLRDGLNLVAKEYVAAKGGEGGVLVLSEFAGAAVELPEAVLADPYSSVSMDRAIVAALNMQKKEQRDRMTKMYQTIRECSIDSWAKELLGIPNATSLG